MQLSKMVQETLTAEEIEVIKEKKKCNKKKSTPMMEDGMTYCAKCGTEYDSALDACPSCGSTETTTQCGAMELNMAKLEASINGGSAEDVSATEAKLKALKASYETTCEDAEEEKSETPSEEKKEEMTESLITETEISAEEKELAWLKSLMSN